MRIVQHPFTFDDIWCWYHAWCLHTCQSIFYQRKFSSKTSKLRTDVQGHFCHHVHHIVSESSSRVGAVEKSNSSGTRDFTGESHSFIYSFFLSFIHSVFHSLMHACVHAFIHPSYHFISSHLISFHFIFLSLQALLHSCPTHKQFTYRLIGLLLSTAIPSFRNFRPGACRALSGSIWYIDVYCHYRVQCTVFIILSR